MNAAAGGGVQPLDAELARPMRLTRSRAVARERVWLWSLWLGMTTWAIVVFWIVRDRHSEFRVGRFDLGNMTQAVWSTAHGNPLEVTDAATGEQVVRMALHVDPILALLAPLWLIAPSPLTLVAAQAIAVALGALPLFWLGRRHLGSHRAATLIAGAYLVYPWTAWAAVDAIHPVTFAIPLLLFAIWFLDNDRLLPFAACAIGVAACGELLGLVIAALGIWYAMSRRRPRVGLGIAGAGCAWTAVALLVVVPAFSGGSSVFYGAFEHVGGSPWGLLETAVTEPATVLAAVTEGRDLRYLVLLTAPLGWLFLLAPGLAAVALPQVGVNLLSSFGATTYPQLHYVSAVIPPLFVATVVGVGRLSLRWRERCAFGVLGLSLAASLTGGPWPKPLGGSPAWWRADVPTPRIAALREAVALVPQGAPVSATNSAGAHLADRRFLHAVPILGNAEWVVLDTRDSWIPQQFGVRRDPASLSAFRRSIERSPNWRKIYDRNGVLVLRRMAT